MSFKANTEKKSYEYWTTSTSTLEEDLFHSPSLFLLLPPSLSLDNLLHPQVFTLYFPFSPICPHNCELCMTIGFRIRRMSSSTGKSACLPADAPSNTSSSPSTSTFSFSSIFILISPLRYDGFAFWRIS